MLTCDESRFTVRKETKNESTYFLGVFYLRYVGISRVYQKKNSD